MRSSEELRNNLRSIDRRSYPAYKSLAGSYNFNFFVLNIEHVQGDPFAAPSNLSVFVSHKTAGYPAAFFDARWKKTALEDYILRRFGRQADRFCYQAKGSGKSGVISASRCGQEILERSACEISSSGITLRFEVGFPAYGRTINAGELDKILFDFLPVCVKQALLRSTAPANELEQVIDLAEDQRFIREQLPLRGLVAFVADGAVLPRESGVSDRPMKNAVPFSSPDSLAVSLDLPHRGPTRGMGIPMGITLIAGGGYHGKSTLLKALERGVYDHVAGDGRELVITDPSALKIRAEDGRKVSHTDISLFISHLPSGSDTSDFSSLDASGSTSQAANVIEGIESGSKLLLIDEDTSATNFMVRDELMQQVISRDHEPITPFLERCRDLYLKAGVSMILVVGSCGAYFHVADLVLQMDAYHTIDITSRAKAALSGRPAPLTSAPNFQLPSRPRPIDLSGASQTRKSYHGDRVVRERLKIKRFGKSAFSLGRDEIDLRYLEQLVDGEQTQTLACLLRFAKENFGARNASVSDTVHALLSILNSKGFPGIFPGESVPSGLAMPRPQEIFACFNRC